MQQQCPLPQARAARRCGTDLRAQSFQIEESRVQGLGLRVEQSAQSVPITADGFGAHC